MLAMNNSSAERADVYPKCKNDERAPQSAICFLPGEAPSQPHKLNGLSAIVFYSFQCKKTEQFVSQSFLSRPED